tara:strand:+ start:167 stop:379 length:213 start_codon:yes stop_codon:yes gene_type:complete
MLGAGRHMVPFRRQYSGGILPQNLSLVRHTVSFAFEWDHRYYGHQPEVHLENEGAVVAGIENTGLISDTI